MRTVVWVAPWVNLDSRDGQYPPDAESARLHRAPAPNYEPEMFVRDRDGEPLVASWWMGTGSPVDFTSPRAEAWWREQAKRRAAPGRAGIKADDGEGWYIPDDARFADGTTGAQTAWGHGLLYRRSMQRALDEVHPGEGVLFGRPGWTGQQAVGITWGGDQPSDFWSLRTLVAATLTAAASGSRTGRTTSAATSASGSSSRCPKELLLRWVQFGCFTPLMHAHGRFEQEAWTYDEETLEVYRATSCCTSGSSPTCAPPRRPRLAAGCRSSARGALIGRPRLDGRRRVRLRAVAVGGAGARGRRARGRRRPAARRLDRVDGRRSPAAARCVAPAPLTASRCGCGAGRSIVTYPAAHVARGLGDTPEASARSRRRCGANRPAAARSPGWPTARWSAALVASGRSPGHVRARRVPHRGLRGRSVPATGPIRCEVEVRLYRRPQGAPRRP